MNDNRTTRTTETTPKTEVTRARAVLMPRADIRETEDAFHLTAEMPGVDATQMDVTLNEGVLTISGAYDARRPEGHRNAYTEFTGGEYRRSFRLSETTDVSKIKASMRDGVLRVSVPKVKPAKAKISVLSG